MDYFIFSLHLSQDISHLTYKLQRESVSFNSQWLFVFIAPPCPLYLDPATVSGAGNVSASYQLPRLDISISLQNELPLITR